VRNGLQVTSILLAVALAACGRATVDAKTAQEMQVAFDEVATEYDPLCVHEGPFPMAEYTPCRKCEALRQAGFLQLRDEQYQLTPLGEKHFEIDPSPEQVELVRTRFERNPGTGVFAPDKLRYPRFCFGRTRFHAIDDALQPMMLSSNTYRSVKLVTVATDTSGLLFDPMLAPLELPVPPKPAKPGDPLLSAPQVVTYEYVSGDPLPTLSDLRYGAWVDAP
jgi:hypothetical protein